MPREVGSWTKDKLRYLSQYLPVYLEATTKAMERIYFDGFAGPGQNRIENTGEVISGSPLIALDAQARNGTRFDKLFFIERDRTAASELRRVLEGRDGGKRARVIEGDVNEKLPNLIRELSKRSPTFVFLDTQGIEPRWSTIEAIAPWKTELLINFPLGMAIKRNLGSPKVTDYFGTDEWKAVFQASAPEQARPLIGLYKTRLKALGYEYTTEADREIKATRGQRLYHLIFVSKVEPARRIMKWVQEQPDSAGQLRFKF